MEIVGDVPPKVYIWLSFLFDNRISLSVKPTIYRKLKFSSFKISIF